MFLSLFDDNPRVKHTLCPPKDTYDPARNLDGAHGTPLPVQGIETPVFAVLGNHDWHGNRCEELVEALSEAGIRMLDKSSAVVEVGETPHEHRVAAEG